MKYDLRNQQGLTFWGLCFVLFFIGILVLFTLRLFPLYNEKFQVMTAIESVTSRQDATDLSENDVQKFFLRNMQITNIRRFNSNNIDEYVEVIKPERTGQPPILHVKFEAENALFSDMWLLMKFDVKRPLRGPIPGE